MNNALVAHAVLSVDAYGGFAFVEKRALCAGVYRHIRSAADLQRLKGVKTCLLNIHVAADGGNPQQLNVV